MPKHCRPRGRNYCAPNGKIAVLFVDIDGTIAVCQRYFDEANARFQHYMGQCGFDQQEAKALMDKIDKSNAEQFGFERDRFPGSMAETYRQLCQKHGRTPDPLEVQICINIGNSVFWNEPELFPDVRAVLNRARHNFYIIAVTIGNRDAQKYKVKRPGLSGIIDDTITTEIDNKEVRVSELIADLNISPKHSAFIGNSKRSDGVCLKVTNFIYLPLEGGWGFDKAELPQNTGFEVFHARSWREAEEGGINRLIRRRQFAVDTQQNSDDE